MNTYNFIFRYFQAVGRAINSSTTDAQVKAGILNAARRLQNSLSNEKRVKVTLSFSFEGNTIFLKGLYWFATVREGKSYEGHIPYNAMDGKHKNLIPNEVYVNIGDTECIYSVADFILLEGFLCPTQQENKSLTPSANEPNE